jgi:hypothetical protein
MEREGVLAVEVPFTLGSGHIDKNHLVRAPKLNQD